MPLPDEWTSVMRAAQGGFFGWALFAVQSLVHMPWRTALRYIVFCGALMSVLVYSGRLWFSFSNEIARESVRTDNACTKDRECALMGATVRADPDVDAVCETANVDCHSWPLERALNTTLAQLKTPPEWLAVGVTSAADRLMLMSLFVAVGIVAWQVLFQRTVASTGDYLTTRRARAYEKAMKTHM